MHFQFSLLSHAEAWEANIFSCGQVIHRLLWNPKVYYRVHNRPPLPVTRLSRLWCFK